MPVIPFLSDKWKRLTWEEARYLADRADYGFKNGECIGWGRRFSIIYFRGEYYAVNSAYGMHHLEKLVGWLQEISAQDYTNYLNIGMRKLGIF